MAAPPARAGLQAPVAAPVLPRAGGVAPAAPGGISRPAEGHPGPTRGGLSLADALALALKHNRDLLGARQALEAAKAGLAAAEATRIPLLSAVAQGSQQAGPPSGTAMLNLSYDLDTHGLRAATIALQQRQRDVAELNLLRTGQAVRFQLLSAYFELIESQEQERIFRQMVALDGQSLSDALALRRVGESTSLDVQRAQVHLAQDRQQLANAQAARLGAEAGLARVIGLDPATALVAVDAVVQRPAWPHSLEATIALGLQRRPELGLLRRQVEVAELQARQARSAYGLQSQVSAGAGGQGSYLPPWQQAPALNLSGQASWLLVDGGAAANNARQADWGAEGARTRLSDTELQVRMEIVQAHAQLKAAEQNIGTAALALRGAHDGLEAARLRFKGGVGTQTDVLLTQDDVEQAEGAMLSAVVSYNRAHAALEQAALAVGLEGSAPPVQRN